MCSIIRPGYDSYPRLLDRLAGPNTRSVRSWVLWDTRSSTATPTSPSSTAPATPRSWSTRPSRLGLAGLAVTDHDGFYGIVRFAVAAQAAGLPTVFGAELGHRSTASRPVGDLVLAEGPVGHARLARAISRGQLAGEKEAPRFSLAALAEDARAPVHLTGNRAGACATTPGWCSPAAGRARCPRALLADGPAAARHALDRLVDAFGRDRVLVELWDHGDPLDRHRNDALATLAGRAGVDVVATNNVHYATPAQRPLATALAAIRAGRSLDEMDGLLPASPLAHLRSPAEQLRRFARWPGAVERTVDIAQQCAFDLRLAAPNLPDLDVPEGHTDMSWLRELTRRGAARALPVDPSAPRAGAAPDRVRARRDRAARLPRATSSCSSTSSSSAGARTSTARAGGARPTARSATRSVVTKADAVALGLLFERFLSPERDGPPDIDIDIEHQRREEVIQYVYAKYGRDRAAQVANVITYRARSAIREMAKVVGCSPGQADALSKQVDRYGRGSSGFATASTSIRRCLPSRSTSPRRCSTSRVTSASTRAGW